MNSSGRDILGSLDSGEQRVAAAAEDCFRAQHQIGALPSRRMALVSYKKPWTSIQ
jgi:hypothetical protein